MGLPIKVVAPAVVIAGALGGAAAWKLGVFGHGEGKPVVKHGGEEDCGCWELKWLPDAVVPTPGAADAPVAAVAKELLKYYDANGSATIDLGDAALHGHPAAETAIGGILALNGQHAATASDLEAIVTRGSTGDERVGGYSKADSTSLGAFILGGSN